MTLSQALLPPDSILAATKGAHAESTSTLPSRAGAIAASAPTATPLLMTRGGADGGAPAGSSRGAASPVRSGSFPLTVLVISLLSRPDRWETITRRLAPFGVVPIRSPGVDVAANSSLVSSSSDYVRGTGKNPGYAGVALAHVHAWQTVAAAQSPMVILEDDVIPLDMDACVAAVETVEPLFDSIQMNTLRPHWNETVNQPLGLMRVDTTTNDGCIHGDLACNIWLSSYVISPGGARRFLDYFHKNPLNTDDDKWGQIDWGLIKALPLMNESGSGPVAFFVINETNRYFVHDESDSDKGRRQTGKTNEDRLTKHDERTPSSCFSRDTTTACRVLGTHVAPLEAMAACWAAGGRVRGAAERGADTAERVPMSALATGDLVLTAYAGTPEVTRIISNQHVHSEHLASPLVTLWTAQGAVTTTPDHALYLDGVLAAAAEAEVGARLTGIGDVERVIERITESRGRVVNPVTVAGTILAADHVGGLPILAATNPMWISRLVLASPLARGVVNAALLCAGDVDTVALGVVAVAFRLAVPCAVLWLLCRRRRRAGAVAVGSAMILREPVYQKGMWPARCCFITWRRISRRISRTPGLGYCKWYRVGGFSPDRTAA